jgi:hypothetical protein
MNDKINKILEEIKDDYTLQDHIAENLTEEEIRYIVDKKSNHTEFVKKGEVLGILRRKERRLKLLDPNTKEIDCSVCKQVLPIDDFDYRRDGKTESKCLSCYVNLMPNIKMRKFFIREDKFC